MKSNNNGGEEYQVTYTTLPVTQNCIQVSIYLIFSQYKAYQIVINNQLLLYYCCCSVTKLCLTLCNTADCSQPGSSVHGSLQAKILEWIDISSFRWFSWPRNLTGVSRVSCIATMNLWSLSHQNLYHWATRKLCCSVE